MILWSCVLWLVTFSTKVRMQWKLMSSFTWVRTLTEKTGSQGANREHCLTEAFPTVFLCLSVFVHNAAPFLLMGCYLNFSLSQVFWVFSLLKLMVQGVQVRYMSECIKDFPVLLSNCRLPSTTLSLFFPKPSIIPCQNTLNTSLLFLYRLTPVLSLFLYSPS